MKYTPRNVFFLGFGLGVMITLMICALVGRW